MTPLPALVQDYLALRRALGYRLEREGRLLPQFAAFLEAQRWPHITTAVALDWATHPPAATPYWAARRLAMVRCLAVYASARDPRTEVPPADLMPYRKARRQPYLYTAADVTALLQACTRLRGPSVRATYTTLLGLLAVTGMRIGEAIALDRGDVDAHAQCVIIRHAKFNKSREVPVHPTTVAALDAYARTRDRVLRRPHSPSFFLSKTGRRLLPQNVWQTFARLRRRAGLPQHPRPPRLHDFRHSFALQTLLRWSRERADLSRRLPLLATYLGHVNPSMTYWYLTATPELLALAAQRIEPIRGASS